MFVNDLELPSSVVKIINKDIWKKMDFTKLSDYISISCKVGTPYSFEQMLLETNSLIKGFQNKEDWLIELFDIENRIFDTSRRVFIDQIVAIGDYDIESPICLFYEENKNVPCVIFLDEEEDDQGYTSWKELAPNFESFLEMLGTGKEGAPPV